MRKFLMTLLLACSTTIFAFAQEAPVKKPSTSFSWSKEALTDIGCSADQIKEIVKIRKDATVKRKELNENTSLSVEDKKAEAKKIMSERNTALMNLLSQEQKDKVNEISKKLKEDAKAAKKVDTKEEK